MSVPPILERAFVSSSMLAMSILLGSLLGCSTFPSPDGGASPQPGAQTSGAMSAAPLEWTPAGPGTTFTTIDEAAIDALGYAYLAGRSTVAQKRRARGGAIRRVEGGYTYDEPALGKASPSVALRYRLAPSDAAHYQYEPAAVAASSASQQHAADREARSFVGERDPLHRPLYTMTPSRTLRVFESAPDLVATRTLGRVAFGTKHDATSLIIALTSGSEVEGRTLAAQPHRLPSAP